MTFRSGKSLSSGNGSFSDSANVCCEKVNVGADAEVLDPQGFEPLVVGLPGQQVRRSGWSEVHAVELEEDPLLTPKVIEGDIDTGGARQAEGGRRLAHLHRPGRP